MAEMIRTDRRSGQAAMAGLVVAAALLAGVVGGLVGARLANGVAAQAAQAPKAAAVDWAQYGTNWESQYRAMYPASVDAKWAQYGSNWESQYRAMNPAVLDPTLVKYGLDWQRQYEQQHPTTFNARWPRYHGAGRGQ
jgi:hypothetical protein